MAIFTTTIRLATMFQCDHPRCIESLTVQERDEGERISAYDLEPGYGPAADLQEQRDAALVLVFVRAGWASVSNSNGYRHYCPDHKERPNHNPEPWKVT